MLLNKLQWEPLAQTRQYMTVVSRTRSSSCTTSEIFLGAVFERRVLSSFLLLCNVFIVSFAFLLTDVLVIMLSCSCGFVICVPRFFFC